jgi:hypothetical protein
MSLLLSLSLQNLSLVLVQINNNYLYAIFAELLSLLTLRMSSFGTIFMSFNVPLHVFSNTIVTHALFF